MQQTDLSHYYNNNYKPGASWLKRSLWFFINAVLFKTSLLPFSILKVLLLRAFGAKIGKQVVIKPCVNIKYPWHLVIGNNTWIGENVWIDSLVTVTIGSDVCVSQGAYLLTGSHNYKKHTFDLITGPIILDNGVWIGAMAIVNHHVTAGSHAVLTAGSVANKNLDGYAVYQGNPAVKIRDRKME